ncbi:MAG: GNAT family N-acetyltransferase [Pseudomonadota bacterium]
MSRDEAVIGPAAGAADIALARALFEEYARWLDFDLCFQDFEAELEGLPGKYAPPAGGIWIARIAGEPAGIVGLRPLEPGICELKRLWLRPGYRGAGLGRRLTETAIAAAKAQRYRLMRLDTITSKMAEAGRLYARLGFRPAEAYYHNPHPEVAYLELDLTACDREAARLSR